MDQVDTQDEKAIAMRAALEKRRERLRAFADTVLEVIEILPTPETFLEAGRAMRVASSLDRFLVRLYSEVDLRAIGSMERAVRRVTKSAPESKPGPEPKPKPTQEELEASAKLLEEKLLRFVDSRRPENQSRPYAAPKNRDPFAPSSPEPPPKNLTARRSDRLSAVTGRRKET